MAKVRANAYLCPADSVHYPLSNGGDYTVKRKGVLELLGAGLLVLRVKKADKRHMLNFVSKLLQRKDFRERELLVNIELYYKKRSNDQNSFYWPLVEILALEAYGEHGYEARVHEALLMRYAPLVTDRATKATIPMRSKDMNTLQFNKLIEGVMKELSEIEVVISDPQDIEKYWFRWQEYRFAEGADPLSGDYKDESDYRYRVGYCEACLTALRFDITHGAYDGIVGHLAHVKSKGAGGSDELKNRLHLCHDCHICTQHQNGWEELIARYPHIGRRIQIIRS